MFALTFFKAPLMSQNKENNLNSSIIYYMLPKSIYFINKIIGYYNE